MSSLLLVEQKLHGSNRHSACVLQITLREPQGEANLNEYTNLRISFSDGICICKGYP